MLKLLHRLYDGSVLCNLWQTDHAVIIQMSNETADTTVVNCSSLTKGLRHLTALAKRDTRETMTDTNKPTEGFTSSRSSIVLGTGKYAVKGRSNLNHPYSLDILGDWVRWTREEILGITLEEAADRFYDRVGKHMDPPRMLTASHWKTQYEQLGRQTNVGQQNRFNMPNEAKCEHIALVLDQPLDTVRMLAGYLPIEAMKRPEVIILSQDMHEDDYREWIAFGSELRRRRRESQ